MNNGSYNLSKQSSGTMVMQETFRVTFDGKVFHPEKNNLELKPNQQYVIKVISQETPQDTAKNAWDLLEEMAGTYVMPEDWSSEHDHYLYGTPKRHLGNE
jgi:hypothetical protein